MNRLLAAIAIAFTVATCPAAAVEINFQTLLRDSDGQIIKDGEGKEASLGRIAMMSLGLRFQEDASATQDSLYRRGALAMRVYEAKAPLDLSVEDLALIKQYIAKAQSPLVIAKAFQLLDPPAAK